MNRMKKLISIVLVLAMTLALMPAAVLAADTTRIYCQAPDDWTTCCVYWWSSSNNSMVWPGKK